jgi:hypothetical protein
MPRTPPDLLTLLPHRPRLTTGPPNHLSRARRSRPRYCLPAASVPGGGRARHNVAEHDGGDRDEVPVHQTDPALRRRREGDGAGARLLSGARDLTPRRSGSARRDPRVAAARPGRERQHRRLRARRHLRSLVDVQRDGMAHCRRAASRPPDHGFDQLPPSCHVRSTSNPPLASRLGVRSTADRHAPRDAQAAWNSAWRCGEASASATAVFSAS